jgi:hypothetical protein
MEMEVSQKPPQDSITIAVIEWDDACIYSNQTSYTREEAEERNKLIRGVAVGIIVTENDDCILVCTDWFPEEGTYRCLNSYPKAGIKHITRHVMKLERGKAALPETNGIVLQQTNPWTTSPSGVKTY